MAFQPSVRVRGVLLIAAMLAAGLVAVGAFASSVTDSWRLVEHAVLGTPSSAAPAEHVLSAAAVVVSSGVLAAVWCWLLLCLTVCLLEAVQGAPRRRVPSSLRPRFAQLLVGAVLGSAVASATPAAAADVADVTEPSPGLPASLDGLPLPDRTRGAPPPEVERRSPRPPRGLVVRPGDTLWDLAGGRLPAAADLRAVDRAWRSIYHANRSVIGPDPDLIHPGTRLRLPATLR